MLLFISGVKPAEDGGQEDGQDEGVKADEQKPEITEDTNTDKQPQGNAGETTEGQGETTEGQGETTEGQGETEQDQKKDNDSREETNAES
jgi:hypothetical protein